MLPILTRAKCGGIEMRRVRTEEDILKEQPVIEDVEPICAVCGAVLEMDEESHEYSCPVCDVEDEE
jgi:rubrerythrin